jgi:hypothetical protein
MSNEDVYIGDLDKLELLCALWQRSKPAAFFAMAGMMSPALDKRGALEEAQKFKWSFDYFQGRLIKADLSGDAVYPAGYDRDNGEGVLAEVAQQVREGKTVTVDSNPRPRGGDDKELDALFALILQAKIEDWERERAAMENVERKEGRPE